MGDGLWSVYEGVADVPEVPIGFYRLHFEIRHGSQQFGIPVDKTFASINQTLLVKTDKGLNNARRHLLVHCEVLTRPVCRSPEAAHLAGDGVARELLPLPDFFDKFLTSEIVTGCFLRVELAFHHNLCGDPSVIRARHEYGVMSAHAVVANQPVHDRLVKGVPHVQGACHVRGWKLDGVRSPSRIALGVLACGKVASFLPLGVPTGLEVCRFKALG